MAATIISAVLAPVKQDRAVGQFDNLILVGVRSGSDVPHLPTRPVVVRIVCERPH